MPEDLSRLAELLVEPYDTPTRFLVHSRTREGELHGVDLAAWSNNGECQCENFGFVHRMKLKSHLPGWHRCTHILLAREYFLQRVLERTAARAREPHPDNVHRNHDPTTDEP